RHPRSHAPACRRARRDGRASGPRRHSPVCTWAWPDRVRDPTLGNLGIRETETRRTRVVGAVADDLAGTRRRTVAVGLPGVGEQASRHGLRATCRPAYSSQRGVAQRADGVLFAVLRAGRALLLGAAVPVRRAWAVSDRNRSPAFAAVAHAAAGRRRHSSI